jgi:UDPglucose 6-dehydrogenase
VSRIFIVGSGAVGTATGRALLHGGHRVSFVDVARRRVAELVAEGFDARTTLDLDGEPESFVFLCLPTPIDPAGDGYQLSAVAAGAEQVGRALATADAPHTVVVRCTVPPGTTEELIRPLLERYSGKREAVSFSLITCTDSLFNATEISLLSEIWQVGFAPTGPTGPTGHGAHGGHRRRSGPPIPRQLRR